MRPGIGHSFIPSLITRIRWSATKPISRPGTTKTCRVKNRDSVDAAMIGPPSNRLTNAGPINGILLAIDDPIPHSQRHQEKNNSDNPGELPRELVCSEEEHLHHVNEDDGDHEIRAPAV